MRTMRTIARFADARSTIEGKMVSAALAALLAFSFLNVAMFTDVAGATEGESGSENEQSLENQDSNEETSSSIEGSQENQNNQNSDSSENAITTEEDNNSNEGTQSDETNSESPSTEGTTESSDGDSDSKEQPTTGVSWDAATGTLSITGVKETLTAEIVEGYLAEKGANKDDVIVLNLNSIGDVAANAFKNWASGLREVSINGAEKIFDHAFSNLKNLQTVKLNNVSELVEEASSVAGVEPQSNAFSECDNLISVSLNQVGFVGAEAFRHCDKLKELTVSNVHEFGRSAFSFCVGLEDVQLDGGQNGILGKTMFYQCTGLKNVELKNFDTIPTQMFNGCSNMEILKLTSIDHVGKNAFLGCTGLKNVNMDQVTIDQNDLHNEKGGYNPPFTGAGAPGMTLIVKNSTIGGYAFYNCIGLTTLNIENVDVVGPNAFWNCTNLTSVDSLSNVTERIDGFAFYGCKNLTGLTVADMTKMGFIGSNEDIMKRVQAILAGKFRLDNAAEISELTPDGEIWTVGAVGKSENWNQYDNGTQIMEQARWSNESAGEAAVQVDALYTGEKQMDYIFVADLSASMAQLGNPEDSNARFYDMQSKLLDMSGQLLNTPGYDCQVAVVTFGGLFNNQETCQYLDFTKDAEALKVHIAALEPLNENTDYGLGLRKAYELIENHEGRNTVLVFLSDGYPTTHGTGQDAYGTKVAPQIKAAGVPIYGVLHSPTVASHDIALSSMKGICDYVYETTDTKSFGEAMNAAFAAVYGTNTVTIPVNSEQFDVDKVEATAGTVEYDGETGVITWVLKDMPFTQHSLTYTMKLKEENLNRTGTYSYSINNASINDGNAKFNGEDGACVGLNLTLSRSVTAPTPTPTMGSYQVVHEYYTGSELDGTVTDTLTAPVGTQVRAADIAPQATYNGNEYELTSNSGSLTVTAGGSGTLVLRYYRAPEPVTPSVPDEPDTPVTPPEPTEPSTPTNPVNPTTPTVPTTPAEPTVPTVPTVTPMTPATPTATTPATAPAAAAPAAAPAATAAPAAVPTPAATEVIEDATTPQAAAPTVTSQNDTTADEVIPEEETPMGAFDEPQCSTHWAMLIGVIATAIYGIAVVRRRLSMAEDVDDLENRILGRVEDSDTASAPAVGQQAL